MCDCSPYTPILTRIRPPNLVAFERAGSFAEMKRHSQRIITGSGLTRVCVSLHIIVARVEPYIFAIHNRRNRRPGTQHKSQCLELGLGFRLWWLVAVNLQSHSTGSAKVRTMMPDATYSSVRRPVACCARARFNERRFRVRRSFRLCDDFLSACHRLRRCRRGLSLRRVHGFCCPEVAAAYCPQLAHKTLRFVISTHLSHAAALIFEPSTDSRCRILHLFAMLPDLAGDGCNRFTIEFSVDLLCGCHASELREKEPRRGASQMTSRG